MSIRLSRVFFHCFWAASDVESLSFRCSRRRLQDITASVSSAMLSSAYHGTIKLKELFNSRTLKSLEGLLFVLSDPVSLGFLLEQWKLHWQWQYRKPKVFPTLLPWFEYETPLCQYFSVIDEISCLKLRKVPEMRIKTLRNDTVSSYILHKRTI